MRKLIISLLFGAMTLTGVAQEKIYQVEEISAINYGDGRLLFRQIDKDKAPLNGEHRLIDGSRSEYILASFKDGMYHGKYQHFKNNKLIEVCTYKDGRKDGEYKRYYGNGTAIQSQITFIDDKADGVSKTFYQNGALETEKIFTLGVGNGFDRRYNSEGKITTDQCYKDGKPDGKWVEHLSGNIGNVKRISNYKNGLREGQWSETWEDGIPRNKSSYKEGKKDGVWVTYRKNGKTEKSTTYKIDEKNGEEIIYFTDGTVEKSINYLNGKKDGLSKEFFYDNGKCKSEYNFKNGKSDGNYKRYFEDGTLREEGRCEHDTEVFRKEYYSNGKLKSVAERRGGGWNTLERYNMDGEKE